jgi:hypothetical protein
MPSTSDVEFKNKLTLNDQLNILNLSQNKNNESNQKDNHIRLNLLNDTYRKRYIEYIKIILVVVITLICVWVCRILETMNYITSSTVNFILITIIGFAVIIICILYKNIQKHNLIVYDQIEYQSPALVLKDTANTSVTTPETTATSSDESTVCTAPIKRNVASSFDSSSLISSYNTLFNLQ